MCEQKEQQIIEMKATKAKLETQLETNNLKLDQYSTRMKQAITSELSTRKSIGIQQEQIQQQQEKIEQQTATIEQQTATIEQQEGQIQESLHELGRLEQFTGKLHKLLEKVQTMHEDANGREWRRPIKRGIRFLTNMTKYYRIPDTSRQQH